MPTILKHGKERPDPAYDLTCDKCDTIARFAKSEGRYVHDQRDGDAVVLKCPVCKAEHWVAAKLFNR